jgi:hypothetical protein
MIKELKTYNLAGTTDYYDSGIKYLSVNDLKKTENLGSGKFFDTFVFS